MANFDGYRKSALERAAQIRGLKARLLDQEPPGASESPSAPSVNTATDRLEALRNLARNARKR